MTAAETLRAAAARLREVADEDDLHSPAGGSDFGPMRPALARLVADWLETTAIRLHRSTHPDWQENIEPQALRVARAVLGEEARDV